MEGSYSRPDGRGQPTMPTDKAHDPTYQVNVSRQKTKKWVEAKTQNYDGDDWGADEFDDDDEPPRNQAPLPPLPGARAAVTTSHLPSQVPNPHSLQVRTQHQEQAALRTASPAISDASANITPPTATSERMVSPPLANVPFAQPPPHTAAPPAQAPPANRPAFIRPSDIYRRMEQAKSPVTEHAGSPVASASPVAPQSRPAGPQPSAAASSPAASFQPQPRGESWQPQQHQQQQPPTAPRAASASFQAPPGGQSFSQPAVGPTPGQSPFQTRSVSLQQAPAPSQQAPASFQTPPRGQSLPQYGNGPQASTGQRPAHSGAPQFLSHPTNDRRMSTSPKLPDLARMSVFGSDDFFSSTTNSFNTEPIPETPDLTQFEAPAKATPVEPAPAEPAKTATPESPAETAATEPTPEPKPETAATPAVVPAAAAAAAATTSASATASEPLKKSPQLLPVDTKAVQSPKIATAPEDEAVQETKAPETRAEATPIELTTPVTTAPTQSVEVTPTQPLQVRKGESPVLDPPPPLQRAGTFDTDTSSPVKESDVLRDEIIRTLSPDPDPRIASLAERESQERNKVRDSSYTLSDYDTYWADSAPPAAAAGSDAARAHATPLGLTKSQEQPAPVPAPTPALASKPVEPVVAKADTNAPVPVPVPVPEPAPVQEHIQPVPRVASALPTEVMAPQTPVADNANQRNPRRRFSWEGDEEVLAPPKQALQQAPAAPVAPGPSAATSAPVAAAVAATAAVAGAAVVAGVAANKASATQPTQEAKPVTTSGSDAKPVDAVKDLSPVPGINVVPETKAITPPEPAAPVDQVEADNQKSVSAVTEDIDDKSAAGSRLSRLSLADEKALTETSSRVVPESPPIADHPALVEPSAGWVPQVLPPVAHPVAAAQTKSFREIMGMGSSKERIASFNETRVSYATTDSGLDQWLTTLRNDHPEHLTKSTALAYVPTSGPPGTASSAQQPPAQQPYYQQYLNATTSSPTTTRSRLGGLSIPSANTTSSFSHSSNQLGTKSKEFMQSAGKMGKGLLSKGKIKLRGSGEKAESPSSPAQKTKPDRRTSWAVNISPKNISPKRKADVPPPAVNHYQPPQHQQHQQHTPSPSVSSRLAPQIPQPEPLSPIEPSADKNDPWAAAVAEQEDSITAADKNKAVPPVPSTALSGASASNDDWASVTRDMTQPATAPNTFAAQDSGVAIQPSQASEDVTPRDASFIGLPPIRRSSTFGLSKAKKAKEAKDRFALDEDDVSLPERSVATPPIAEHTATTEPDISDDNASAATSGKQAAAAAAAPISESAKAAVQTPSAANAGEALHGAPSNGLVQYQGNMVAQHGPEFRQAGPAYPNGSMPPPNHAGGPPMMMPNQHFAGSGPWKLEESYLAEPLNQVSRNRSGTSGSRSPAFPGFEGRPGFPGPQGPEFGGANQPRSQDMPPSSAQRYPGLFAPQGDGAMPHLGQGAGWRGDGPNPRGTSSEFGIAGMGPPGPEERGRSKRGSGIFNQIGDKIARATSRDRFSSNADGRLSRTNTRDEYTSENAEDMQDNKKRRSSFMMNLGRRGSMEQSRPQDSFGPPKRAATDMSFGTEDSQGRRKSFMNTLAAAQNKFLPSTGSRLSMSMSRPEYEDEATTPSKKKRFSDMTKLFRKSKNTDGSDRPPSRNALSTFSSQQGSRPGSNDWAAPRQRSGTLGSMENGDGATTPRGRGSSMANFFARRSGSHQRTGEVADPSRQPQAAQQGPVDSSIHSQNWQNIPRPPSQQRRDGSIPANRSRANSNRNSTDFEQRRTSQLWTQPATASPLTYGLPTPAPFKPHADGDSGVRQSMSSEAGDPSADTLEGSTLQMPHQGLAIPDLDGSGKRPMSADDDTRTERGDQDVHEPEQQERRESEAITAPTESRPSITSLASSMISRQDTNDSTSDVADTTVSRSSVASPTDRQTPSQEQTPMQPPVVQHAANFNPASGANEPAPPSGWNRAQQAPQPPMGGTPGYGHMRVDQYGRPMGPVPVPVDQYGRPLGSAHPSQQPQHSQQPYQQAYQQPQQQQQHPNMGAVYGNNLPPHMGDGAPGSQTPVNASPRSKMSLDKALPAAPDKNEREGGSRWKGLRSKMTEQMNNMSQGMSREDKPEKADKGDRTDRHSGKKLMDAFKRSSKQADAPVTSPGKSAPGYYNHYLESPGQGDPPQQSQSQPMSPHEQMYVVSPQHRMSAQNNYFPPQPSARSSTMPVGFPGPQAPAPASIQGTLLNQMRQPPPGAANHREPETPIRTDLQFSQPLPRNAPPSHSPQSVSPQPPRHSGYGQPAHVSQEPSPESQRDVRETVPVSSPGVRIVHDEPAPPQQQPRASPPVQKQPEIAVGTGHEEPEDVVVTPMSAFPKPTKAEPVNEAKRASVASKPAEPSPVIENVQAAAVVAAPLAAASATTTAAVASESPAKEPSSSFNIELEDTADARQRTIRLESQEEKIAYDPLDAEPVMAATSYPGQEWNPYGDNFGDWTED
ncbi:hypothetical protein VHEMI07171 [[Torrubiella] hemipterigena]|uniref:SWI-SNF chromatin-remodeling complex protein n=1 Tax=[Torrubiella] hemipterigena TaxID=1531966 RepID=A0A0A1T2P2_9HYPO|nr:hypothetical protein VHEMI07171 [[Torrubiella] hemipterigena]